MNIILPALQGLNESLSLAPPPDTWTHDEVRDELSRILCSRFFVKSARLSCFLSTAVDYLLAGKASSFKEFTVGTEVYGRSATYDPTLDTIVRTEARRLRSKLKEYYADLARPNRLRISAHAPVDYGLGNIQPQFYLSPAHPGKFIWGAGPQLWLPTATDSELGTNKWGGGPAMVGLIRQGHWLGGSLLSNQFAGINHKHIDSMTLNSFLFYNMAHGWYFVSTPVITADWTASRSNRWTVPVGGGVGRVFKLGAQPLNARAEFFNDVRTTTGGSDWQMQTQLQFLFIKKHRPATAAVAR